MGQNLFIAETPDELNPAPEGWVWIKPSTGQIFELDEGVWVEHPVTFNNIKLSGNIDIDDKRGVTKTVNNPTKIKVHKGIVVEVE